MATMIKSRTRSGSKTKKATFNADTRATAFSDSHHVPSINRNVEAPEESVEIGEEPELRQQSREEGPDAGISSDFVAFESGFTHGRSRS
jgi:hypothetical protein